MNKNHMFLFLFLQLQFLKGTLDYDNNNNVKYLMEFMKTDASLKIWLPDTSHETYTIYSAYSYS